MSSVIDFRAWRARHAPMPVAVAETADEPVYSCSGCGSRLFRLLETGHLRCARCSAEIRPDTTVAAENRNRIPPWIPVVSLFALLIIVGTYVVVSEVGFIAALL
jgi:DNA-directed RNA polymerase subunit RPC12/RpoP